MIQITAEQARYAEVFHPHLLAKANEVIGTDRRFVHYTSAAAVTSILKNREVWMRKSSCMSDYSEVEHGLNCLSHAYNDQNVHSQRYRAALESVFPEITAEVQELFNSWQPHFKTDTYLACFSVHDDREDLTGRLSMWRAYGSDTGVAVVMRNTPFITGTDGLKAVASPVLYLDDPQYSGILGQMADGIEHNRDFAKSMGRETFLGGIFRALRFSVLCAKHPGFREEQEWRVLYSPKLENSRHIKSEIRVVGGVPQQICKIPLRDDPDDQIAGIEIPALVDRIIIGPTSYRHAAWEAFVELLRQAGVTDPEKKVFVSTIPLRQR